MEGVQDLQHMPAGLGVQSAGGLIGHDDGGVGGDGPGDGHPLLLASGQVVGQILELAPSICVHGPDDRRKVFADFGDVVLVGSAGRKIVDFATWEWDYGRSAVYAGHFFSDNYEAAKQDFAVRAGFVNGQRLFSDQQLGVIRNACEFALEGDATLSFEEEKLLRSVQEQIEDLFPIQQEPEQELEREQEPELEREQEQEPEQAPGQEAEQEQRFGMEMTM